MGCSWSTAKTFYKGMEAKAVMRALVGVRALARAAAPPSQVRGSRGKHQGTEHPSLAQQSGLSTQSCQKTSTNDSKAWSGRGGIHPVFTNIEQHRAKVAVSDVYGDFTYEGVYLRSWDLAKGILGLLGQVCFIFLLLFCLLKALGV